MEYILVQHEGFKEEYLNQIKPLEGVSSDELVRRYNKEVDTGIVGVYAQGIFLAALRIAFIKKFKQSPILIKDNLIISFLFLENKTSLFSSIPNYEKHIVLYESTADKL